MLQFEMKDHERLINWVVLCSGVGIVMALAVATAMVYGEASSDRLQPTGIPGDRALDLAQTHKGRPHQ